MQVRERSRARRRDEAAPGERAVAVGGAALFEGFVEVAAEPAAAVVGVVVVSPPTVPQASAPPAGTVVARPLTRLARLGPRRAGWGLDGDLRVRRVFSTISVGKRFRCAGAPAPRARGERRDGGRGSERTRVKRVGTPREERQEGGDGRRKEEKKRSWDASVYHPLYPQETLSNLQPSPSFVFWGDLGVRNPARGPSPVGSFRVSPSPTDIVGT